MSSAFQGTRASALSFAINEVWLRQQNVRFEYDLTRGAAGRKLSIEQRSLCVPTYAFTIQKLSDAAGVGVESIRYYQRRGLLAEPARVEGGFRAYSGVHVQRLRFIKRAQELGYSLDDVGELMTLSGNRDRARIQALTRNRLADIRERIVHLQAMALALTTMAQGCEKAAPEDECPIIAALTRPPDHANGQSTSRRTPKDAVVRTGLAARPAKRLSKAATA